MSVLDEPFYLGTTYRAFQGDFGQKRSKFIEKLLILWFSGIIGYDQGGQFMEVNLYMEDS